MSKVLFTHSYFYRFDPKQWKAKQPYPPYGSICAAALIRACGFDVQLFDTNLKHGPQEIQPVLQAQQPRYLVLYDDGFNYLTKMCLTRMREAAFELIRLGKKQGCTVIVNSSDSTDHLAAYLDKGADYIIIGEGEWTLRELLLHLEAGAGPAHNIAGLAFPTPDGGVHQTAKRSVSQHLDELPDAAWDLVEENAYRDLWLRYHGYFSLNIATTRGCPYKCNWCAKPIYGNRYNTRSPERVVAEIAHLMQQYGVAHFWMSDDIFGLKPGWVQRFRDLVQERKLQFSYKIQSRVDLLLKEDTIDALAASGLRQVWVGAESGAQRILDAMDKGITVQEIHDATNLLKKKGIEVCFFLQFGYLGEQKTDIDSTIRMVETLMPHDIGISVSYPLPGTKFYEKVKNTLGVKQNWEQSDDLDMMYPSTFPAAYYRRLHRYVHKRFRLRQGLQELRPQNRPINWRRLLLLGYYAPAVLIDQWRLKKY